MKKTLNTIAMLFMFCAVMLGQAPRSAMKSQPLENHGLYSIGLQDLSVRINVPVRSKPGFSASFNGSLNAVTTVWNSTLNEVQVSPVEVNLLSGGSVNGVIGSSTSVISSAAASALCPDNVTHTYIFSGWSFTDANGNVHPLPGTDYIDNEAIDGTGLSCKQSHFIDQTVDYVASVHVTAGSRSGTATVTLNSGGTIGAALVFPSSSVPHYSSGVMDSYTDSHGNITSANSTFTSYTDIMLGTTPLTSTGLGGAPTFSWTDINGGTQQTAINTGAFKRKTSYGCSSSGFYDITDTTSINLMTGVTFPDSTFSMTYEANGTGYTTGRLHVLTLPAGGTVTFAYSGFNCTYLQTTQMTVTTTDGTWTYSWAPLTYGSGQSETFGSATTVKDPAGNTTVYSFIGVPATLNVWSSPMTTQIQSFHYGSSTADKTVGMCYDNVLTNCMSTVPTMPLTQVDTYTTLAGMSANQRTTKTLDVYGNVLSDKAYDYNGTYLQSTASYGTGCGTGAAIKNRPCTTAVYYNSGTEVMGTTNTYNSAGDLLTANAYMPGNTTLTTTNTYNTNGTLATSKDPAGITTSYTYGECNGFGLTQTTVNSLNTYKTYGTAGCDGGVPVTATDANGKTTSFTYTNPGTGAADPYYRVGTTTDAQGDNFYRYYAPTYNISQFNFGSSLQYVVTDFDGYGRALRTRKQQGPGSSYDDTVSYTYGQSTTGGLGAIRTSSVPCTVTAGADCTAGLTTTQFDYLGRPSTITDGGGGVRTYTYNQNDLEVTLSPAPSGENTKSVLMEVNGLGMTTIGCPITGFGGSSCGANTTGTGYPTTNALTTGTGTFTTTTTLSSQTKTKVFDALGRITSETYPESGTTTYVYDVVSGCSGSQNGKLGKKVDAKGNILCYAYDTYGRLSKISANGTSCHVYFYDTSTGFSGTIPTGISISNSLGRMVEAATSNCLTTLITDEWFSYDSLGRLTDKWELTPHSKVNGTQVYYHVTEAYNANGAPATETFHGIDASDTVVNYGIDGEGRWTSAAIGSANEITSVAYNAAQQPTQILFPTGEVGTTTTAAIAQHATTFTVASATDIVANQNLTVDPNGISEQVQVVSKSGTTITIAAPGFHHSHNSGVPVNSQNGDEDTYSYSGTTGRMASFNILSDESGGSLTGSLTWSANGTLSSLLIGDSFNAGGNQTCNFTYDDLARVASDLCGTGSTNYRSTISYDKYGNITKSSSNGTAPVWPQSGSYSASTNRLSSSTYDSNGSALTDFFHTYTWDGFNRLSTLDTSTLTYDALGKVVETANGGVYTVFEYTPIGSKIVWNQLNTWTRGHLPMPGGTSLDWTPSATYIHHKDWLGSSRITTTAGVVYTDKAFGAYGEDTAQDFGPAVNFNFTGDTQDIATAVYDTPNREYMPYQSRWPNVDPSHRGWNGYAYAANPLSFVDPSGLDDVNVDLYSMNVALYGTEGSGGSTDMGTSTNGIWGVSTGDLNMQPLDIWSFVGTGNGGGGTLGDWTDSGFASGLVGSGDSGQMVMTSETQNNFGNQSDSTRVSNNDSPNTAIVTRSPDPWATLNMSLSIMPVAGFELQGEIVAGKSLGSWIAKFAAENPQYRYAVCGECAKASMEFQNMVFQETGNLEDLTGLWVNSNTSNLPASMDYVNGWHYVVITREGTVIDWTAAQYGRMESFPLMYTAF